MAHWNALRCTPDKSLDREYLRTCAIYRLLKHGHINKAKAVEFSRRPVRGCHVKPDRLLGTIELWLAGPLKDRAKPMTGYYVTMQRDSRTAWLFGPLPSHALALAMVATVRDVASRADPFTHFDAFGTASRTGLSLPAGVLNNCDPLLKYVSETQQFT